ncbi:hypothetical protein [Sinomicrobium sp. M5D2P17]
MSRLENFGKNQDLQDCLTKIEDKLGWGESSGWSSYDFEKLSVYIYQGTGMKLSANTLKRVWGRLHYQSAPSTTTLNILAQYLGFDDWRNFVTRKERKEKLLNPSRIKKHYFVALPVLIFSFLLYMLLSGSFFLGKRMEPSDFSFSSKKITKGIPNSVVFEYCTPSYIKGRDKLEIQQSWDESKRHSVSNSDSIATSVYYSPGYFMAKLVANDIVVKEHGLLIPSNGWLGLLEGDGYPIYLNEDDIVLNNRIEISDSILKERLHKDSNDQEPVKLYYIKDFRDLYLDDFTIDMVIGSDENGQQRACQASSITIYCEGQVIIVPLAPKGCVSEINLRILDLLISGKTNDLSNFGVDMHEDITVRLSSSGGQLSIFINNMPAYSIKLEKTKLRSISGIRYNFKGSGSINKIVIRNKEQVFLSRGNAS